MEGNKAGKGGWGTLVEEWLQFLKVVKEGFPEEVAFAQRSNRHRDAEERAFQAERTVSTKALTKWVWEV